MQQILLALPVRVSSGAFAANNLNQELISIDSDIDDKDILRKQLGEQCND